MVNCDYLGTELRVSRGSCSVIMAHQLRFEALDSSISKNATQSEIFDMRSEISELRDENYTLKKRIKELQLQLDQKARGRQLVRLVYEYAEM